jgi:hypothetical protein
MSTSTSITRQPRHTYFSKMSMFGALNRLISRLDAEPQAQKTNSRSPAGFQVLRNINPEVHIEPWFDFVIGINGRSIVSRIARLA